MKGLFVLMSFLSLESAKRPRAAGRRVAVVWALSGRRVAITIGRSIFAWANMPVAMADKVDLMFKAFSDRTRLRLLYLLRSKETCVCDLVDVLGVPQSKVSRHLAYLRRAGLVSARKDGFWMHYQLVPATTEFHKSLLKCLDCCSTLVPELAKDAERLSRSRASCESSCCS